MNPTPHSVTQTLTRERKQPVAQAVVMTHLQPTERLTGIRINRGRHGRSLSGRCYAAVSSPRSTLTPAVFGPTSRRGPFQVAG